MMDDPAVKADEPATHLTDGRARIVFVLVVLMAFVPLARNVVLLWTPPGSPRLPSDIWASFNFYGRYIAAYLCAGLLLNRYDLRRVVGLALIGWCVLVLLGAVLRDSLSLAAMHLAVTLVYGIIEVVPYVAIKRGIRSGATAPALVIVAFANLAGAPLGSFLRQIIVASAPHTDDRSFDRLWIALVCATLGALITWIWLVVYRGAGLSQRRGQRSATVWLSRLLSDPRVWALLALTGLGAAIMVTSEPRLFQFLDRERGVAERSVSLAIDLPYLVAILGTLAAAVWSDRILRETGSLATARRPFVVAGFVLCIALGLVPLVRQSDLIAMACVAALGVGIQMLVTVVAVDIAPASAIGLFSGLVAAFGTAIRFASVMFTVPLYRAWHSLAPVLVAGALLGLVGAVAAFWLLRRIQPIAEEGGTQEDLPSVFA